ncbi:MAG: PTS sugar transporter subunit IIA [Candidatus Aadella gelida]|nr:PTS sugar transporter subunit IIA [Candidatus Aadella gelida]
MIDINRYLDSDKILADIGACNKEEAIKALVGAVFRDSKTADFPINEEHAVKAVMERENLQSTGVGNRVSFPHARIGGWKGFSLAIGISRDGIDFSSIDGSPVNIVVLMISSQEEPYIILQSMATISRIVMETGLVDSILTGRYSPKQIKEKFEQVNINSTEQILAADVARPVMNHVTLDTSIEEATRKMHLNKLDILAVLDEKNKYCGEISCLDIFDCGIPNFFKSLNTVSFVRHIDPFEKYFKIKGDLTVRDLYKKGEFFIHNDATLMEIIFEMTVKKKSKLFVVEKNMELVGAIDRFCIIDKVLFF